MDCDDVMLALANSAQTLSYQEQAGFHAHLEDCEECRALAVDTTTAWRWISRLPEDAFEDGATMALPTVDPIVFDIDREIAAGGMGRITKATDRRLNRDVALKEVLELSMRARFEREAMITARLQHPAIVPIYEAGMFPNGHPFYTMRLVSGGTLGGVIHKTQTMAERLALLPHVIAVTDALAYAHSNRIIHRDLKPGNVLVGEFGETVVIDWGLAKELGTSIDAGTEMMATGFGPPVKPSSPNLTRVGSVLGTPGFMSPEQASGGSLDERADVYALGAILYNLLSGTPPYWDKHDADKGGSTRMIAIGLLEPPTPIAELAPEAPADLRMIVERAMARRKEDRYPTAKEMAEELRRFAAGKLITREYTLRELVWRWIKKHRTPVVVGAIAALALAVVVVFAFIYIARSRGAEIEARKEAQKSEGKAVEEAAKAKQTAASLQADQGVRELADGDGARALAYLAAAYVEPTQDRALHYLLTAASHDLEMHVHAYPTGKAIAFGGERLAIYGNDGNVLIDGVVTTRVSADRVTHASFDRDALSLALQRTTQLNAPRLEVWDVASGTLRLEIKDLANGRLVFSPDGRRTASFGGNQLFVHDLGGAAPATQVLSDQTTREINDAAIDDQYVATCGADGVSVWSLANPAQPPRKLEAECGLIAFLDPGQMVIANKRLELLRWKVGDARPDRTMSGHIPINVIAVSKGKRRIATGDATGVVMWNWDGDALGESRDIIGGIDKLAFTPDGSGFVGAGAADRLFVWDTESFHLRQAFGGGYGSLNRLAIAPSGDRIASLAVEGAHVWRVPKGRLVERAPGTQFVVAGNVWLAITDKTLTIRSLVDPTIPSRTLEHGLDPRPCDSRAGLADRACGSIAVRAGTERVTLIGARGEIATFDPSQGTLAKRTLASTTEVSADPRFAVDRDGKRIAILDTATGKPIRELPAEKALRAVIGGNGKHVAVLSATHLERFAIDNGHRDAIAELAAGHSYDGRFDPTGRRLVLFGAHLPTLVLDGGRLSELATAHSATGVVFSADGSRAALGVGNTVQFWDLGRTSPVFTVSSTIPDAYAITGDGALLATGSVDGSIRIWDASGRLLDRLVGSQTGITRLAFARDDDRLLGQSEDGASVWDVHVEHRAPTEIQSAAGQRCAWKIDGAKLVLNPRHENN